MIVVMMTWMKSAVACRMSQGSCNKDQCAVAVRISRMGKAEKVDKGRCLQCLH